MAAISIMAAFWCRKLQGKWLQLNSFFSDVLFWSNAPPIIKCINGFITMIFIIGNNGVISAGGMVCDNVFFTFLFTFLLPLLFAKCLYYWCLNKDEQLLFLVYYLLPDSIYRIGYGIIKGLWLFGPDIKSTGIYV